LRRAIKALRDGARSIPNEKKREEKREEHGRGRGERDGGAGERELFCGY